MKKLLLFSIVLLVLALVGCTSGITPTPEPEPEPVMEAVALAELIPKLSPDTIRWSIVNVGDEFIREYTLTFVVEYPDIAVVTRDYVGIKVTGYYLEVDDIHSGEIGLVPYDSPESVSVSWELFE